jgi:ketosteroid isomerase-like protein
MSEQQTTKAPVRRWLTRTLVVPVAAVVLAVAPGIALAGSGDGGTGASDHDPKVAEAVGMQEKIAEYWNARQWDRYAALYEDDAIALPPNHEPIYGNTNIAAFYAGVRDVAGEIAGHGTYRATASGNGDLVAVVGNYSSYSGQLSYTTHEVWRRQPDGSLKMHIDMFGLRHPGM